MKESPQYELLSAYLDGAVSAEERARVEQWLADDPGALRALDELRAVSASLASLPASKLDDDLSERVLRAAERHILSEPSRLAVGSRPASPAKTVSVRALGRRLLTSRGLVWSSMAMAAAVVLTLFQLRLPDEEHSVVKVAAESATAERDVFVIGPVGDESAVGSRPAFEPSADMLPESSPPEGELPFAGASAPAPSIATRSRVDTTTKFELERTFAAPEPPADLRLEADGAPRRAPSPDELVADMAVADTAVARAARNPDELLVVDCRFSPAALKDGAFARTLAAHGIDVVETPDVEEPLARQLVESVVSFSSILVPIEPGEDESEAIWRRAEAAGRESDMQLSKPVVTVPPGSPSVAAAEPPAEARSREMAFGFAGAPVGGEVELVLVEGSPRQISATIAALRSRSDAAVSVTPRRQAMLERARGHHDARLDTTDESAQMYRAGEKAKEVRKGEAPEVRKRPDAVVGKAMAGAIGERAADRREVGRPDEDRQAASPRATAQRLGRMALQEPSSPRKEGGLEMGLDAADDFGVGAAAVGQTPTERAAGQIAMEHERSARRAKSAKPMSPTPKGIDPRQRRQTLEALAASDEEPRLQRVLFVLHSTPLVEPARAAAAIEGKASVPAAEKSPAPSSVPADNRD